MKCVIKNNKILVDRWRFKLLRRITLVGPVKWGPCHHGLVRCGHLIQDENCDLLVDSKLF